MAATLIIFSSAADARCSVDTVIVKGRVEPSPPNTVVRVRLVFPKNKPGESAEATIEADGTFNVPVEFVTQSRGPIVNGLGGKCDRKPESVIVSLVRDSVEQPLDEITLNFHRDFKMVDASAYALRSELVLHSPQ